MDSPTATVSNSTEDLSSIQTNVDSQSISNVSADLDDAEKRIQELNKQLEQSQFAEKKAREERDHYLYMYHRTHQHFLAFEHKQLDQMRRIFDRLSADEQQKVFFGNIDDQRRPRRAFTSPSTAILLPSSFNHPLDDFDRHVEPCQEEEESKELLGKISELMDLGEKVTMKCAEQVDENNKLRLINHEKQEENMKLLFDLSTTRAACEQQAHLRLELEQQLNEAKTIIEQDHSKRLQKLRNYATLADDEGDILLSSLMRKAEKNDLDFREMKSRFDSAFLEQVEQIKTLIKERELLRLYIKRLEKENASLTAINRSDQTVQLITRAAVVPTSFEEALGLVEELREEIMDQMKIEEKLRNDVEQIEQNYKLDLREREQIEEMLNRDLAAAKDEIVLLETVKSEYERVVIAKTNLEKQVAQLEYEIKTLKTASSSLVNQLKEQMEQLKREKEQLAEENASLRLQVQKLRIDFETSESVQYDFVKLSQALQMQLEEIRTSENELRWQPEEDFNECQRCHIPFSVTVRKHHCRHCGKVMCKECTSRIVYTGPNRRPSRVCDVCHTLLVKTSQPYFLAGTPKV